MTMRLFPFVLTIIATLATLAACSNQHPAAIADDKSAPPMVNATDKLVGQWNGPEGSYLLLAGVSGKYAITIRNLDGSRTFQGRGGNIAIHFSRDGKDQAIRATDGAGTGMKWLAEKKNCIVIVPGEGYCRD
jgi:hypothetical protein